jgi:hypothetical protein
MGSPRVGSNPTSVVFRGLRVFTVPEKGGGCGSHGAVPALGKSGQPTRMPPIEILMGGGFGPHAAVPGPRVEKAGQPQGGHPSRSRWMAGAGDMQRSPRDSRPAAKEGTHRDLDGWRGSPIDGLRPLTKKKTLEEKRELFLKRRFWGLNHNPRGMHPYTYIYTHMHPYTNIYTHIQTYIYTYTYIHSLHKLTYSYKYMHIHTFLV